MKGIEGVCFCSLWLVLHVVNGVNCIKAPFSWQKVHLFCSKFGDVWYYLSYLVHIWQCFTGGITKIANCLCNKGALKFASHVRIAPLSPYHNQQGSYCALHMARHKTCWCAGKAFIELSRQLCTSCLFHVRRLRIKSVLQIFKPGHALPCQGVKDIRRMYLYALLRHYKYARSGSLNPFHSSQGFNAIYNLPADQVIVLPLHNFINLICSYSWYACTYG